MAVEQLMDDAWYIIIYTYFGTENQKMCFLRKSLTDNVFSTKIKTIVCIKYVFYTNN